MKRAWLLLAGASAIALWPWASARAQADAVLDDSPPDFVEHRGEDPSASDVAAAHSAEPGEQVAEPNAEAEHAGAEPGGAGEHGENGAAIQNLGDFTAWWRDKAHTPPPFLAALFNFVIFATLLGAFAGPALVKYARRRSRAIATELDQAARLRHEAEQKLDEYAQRLSALEPEVRALVDRIRQEAQAEKDRIVKDARARAERLRKDAEAQIQAEMARAKLSIEREAVIAAVAMAETILRGKTTDQDEADLMAGFLQRVETTDLSDPSRPGGAGPAAGASSAGSMLRKGEVA